MKPDDLLHKLYEWLDTQPEPKNEKEAQAHIEQFMSMHNAGGIDDYEKSAEEESYDLMELAAETSDITKARKLLKRAIKLADLTDAHLQLMGLYDKPAKEVEAELRKLLAKEKRALGKEFNDNVGQFWTWFDSRPYMRVMAELFLLYMNNNEYDKARKTVEEMLRLNPNDNQGVRYMYSALLVHLGDDSAFRRYVKQYDEPSAYCLVPQLIFAYKESDKKYGARIIKDLEEHNPYVVKFFTEKMPTKKAIAEAFIEPYYQVGTELEAIMAIGDFEFLINECDGMNDWILSL